MRPAPLFFLLLLPTYLTRAEEKPFPENRLRDFYVDQARLFLDSDKPLPPILPQFPGLDGGTWGHWGQNPESHNADPRLGEVDTSGLLMQVTSFPGGKANKGVNVRVGTHTVVFDPEKLAYVAAWKGAWVSWSSRRYGITSGVKPGAEPALDLSGSRWILPDGTATSYHGFYRNGEQIVFKYTIGEATIYDTVREDAGHLIRHLTVDGTQPAGTRIESVLPFAIDKGDTKALATPGFPRWLGKSVTTNGALGTGDTAYAIDTLAVPYRDQNPFKTPMRIGGVGIMPDGKIAVSTLMGDVWLVEDSDGNMTSLKWTRFASGLHQPLGLVVGGGKVHVIGRDQLTCLHDLNSDGEADFYECLTNGFPTAAGNSFALTLHQDSVGRFYWFTRSDQFGMTRFTPGTKPEPIATGLRGANGSGVSPDGDIVLVAPQEGSWQPATAICEVGGGSYHGFFGPKPEFGKHGYDLPLCFVPRGIDNSPGDLVFLPGDKRLGPLAGHIVGTSFGTCQHYLVLREEIGGEVQGGIVPLPGEFLSGAHRLRFNPHDGCIYVAGTDGWQSYAAENGSLQRVRYTGMPMHLPTKIETRGNGFLITFNTEIDPASLRADRAFAEQWNYLYSAAYGSPEYSVKNPGQQGHDPVRIGSLHLLPNKHTIFVEIPQLHPVMQLHLYLELRSATGEKITPDIYYSIFHQAGPFTDFKGYTATVKEPWNDFPAPGKNPVDPRLVAQENLAKIVGDEAALAAIEKREISAVAGLQFEPNSLAVKAGSRVALTVRNEDPSMPHNFVLVHPDALETVGEGSMKLAATPEGLAQHYVIKDENVLALSPILPPGCSYIVYFNAPKEPGHYPFLCTFPGHWKVTRGTLIVSE